ncbi:MAG TPA: tetratricopeptide repeat protein [Burkholderiaceae bacterium]|jgi:hypothetical protein
MFKKFALSILLSVSSAYVSVALAADDPSLHQVYQAAEAGRLDEAQGMMAKVLQDHPNSAKAHFVESELLAKQGRFTNAESELNTAEHLAPGLPFAKPQAVQNLQSLLASPHQVSHDGMPLQNQAMGGFPWGMVIIGMGILAVIALFMRSMMRGNSSLQSVGSGVGYPPGSPLSSYPNGTVAPPMGSAAGGLGSGILGGLATGAAVGAGMVAGEALMHHFTDGATRPSNPVQPLDNAWNAAPDDMGGADFGIANNNSWDDSGGSSGGNDWD